jgi:hypothetical protein
MEIHNPDIILILKTMEEGKKIVRDLSRFMKELKFLSIHVTERYRGLVTRWRRLKSNTID